MAENSLFQTFCFPRGYIFFFYFQKLKQKCNIFIFITVDKLWYKLQESRATFYFNAYKKNLLWRKFLNKFPAVYNQIECMSLEIVL